MADVSMDMHLTADECESTQSYARNSVTHWTDDEQDRMTLTFQGITFYIPSEGIDAFAKEFNRLNDKLQSLVTDRNEALISATLTDAKRDINDILESTNFTAEEVLAIIVEDNA